MGSRGVVIGATALILVAGGAVSVDRLAARAASDVAAREIVTGFDGVTGQPEVTIGGFPFLTQLVAGKLKVVTARVDGLTFDGVAVTGVELDAEGVTTSEPYTVDHAVLTGTLSVETLQELAATEAGVDLNLGLEGDRLVARSTLFGLDLAATLVPRAQDGGIRVEVTTVTLAGLAFDVADLPTVLSEQLSDLAVPVAGLPDGVALTGVVVRDGGVRITATGTDVVLPAEIPDSTP